MPSITLPLQYCFQPVGRALVDEELFPLRNLVWGLEIPKHVRKAHNRPDVILATLQADDGLLTQCHPFLQLGWTTQVRLVLRLSHIALRPEIVPHLLRFHEATRKEQEVIQTQIRMRLSSIQRVHFVNRNRVDCRKENLREISRTDLGDSDAVRFKDREDEG